MNLFIIKVEFYIINYRKRRKLYRDLVVLYLVLISCYNVNNCNCNFFYINDVYIIVISFWISFVRYL